ncbi:L,D-transpeptidase [Embleya hyalina]|uniref:Murein L,D-transpeptidase n=1 Tax=Embleya hyalina TaxID=516124 RepID=A0A401YQI7_9ACTN|nr:L,D-transpeptidase [Embleya hyalina]GCD96884.1 murein L,D-transpeptidase [Embleya hyalina]
MRGWRNPTRRIALSAVIAGLLVPLGAVVAAPAQAAASCGTGTGTHQRRVEAALGLKVDGVSSAADCRAIRAFQVAQSITPAVGYAGPITASVAESVARQNAAARNPNAAGLCPTNVGRVACVDLTAQISWIQNGQDVVRAPVAVRTGRDGFETRPGRFRIFWRHRDHVSSIYHVPMPHSQFFDGDIAFHAIDGPMWSAPGSHGCVNMRPQDAKAYWDTLRTGDKVVVFGNKPGT